jgi:hypothetical protein
MREDVDKRLREALQPVDPGVGFTDAVMSRIGARDERVDDAQPGEGSAAHAEVDRSRPVGFPGRARVWRWLSGAAAAIVIAGLLVNAQQARHTREGLAARQALMEALQVTAKSLAVAKRALNDSSAPASAPDSGV